MTRRRRRIIWFSILAVILVFCGFYLMVSMPRISAQQQTVAIAKKAGLTDVDHFSMYQRQQTYYAVNGYNKQQQLTYVIVNGKTGKIKLLAGSKGLSQNQVRTIVKQRYQPAKIYGISLGLDGGDPVWEVAVKKSNGHLSYRLLDFYTGKTVDLIDNL